MTLRSSGRLREGSVLAVSAPDNTTWLAITTTDASLTDVRFNVRWLNLVNEKKRSRTDELLSIFSLGTETKIWRDCVLADITEQVNSSGTTWTIRTSALQQMAHQQQEQVAPEYEAIASTTIDELYLHDDFATKLLTACHDAIVVVSTIIVALLCETIV
jgi:hypothetical protein